VIDALASAQQPWPNTEQKIVLVCRVAQPEEKYGANEFIDKDGKICRWVLETKK
jgi:hypothetical protein